MNSIKQRLLEKIDIRENDECWPWLASVDSRGYGNLRVGSKKHARAHRLMYEFYCGPIPDGEGFHGTIVMHKCDNRICCNPNHLTLGSHADNMADMADKDRRKGIGAGESNGRAILSVSDVEQIRRDTRGTRTIAKDYPVSRAAIQRIKSGKAWASA